MKNLFTLIFISLLTISSLAQTAQTVVVEHFTNTLCGNCAARNPVFYDLLDSYPGVIHIAYHPSAPYPNCVLHQHNASENDARANFYGAYGGTPTAVVQGEWTGFQNPILTASELEAFLGNTTDYELRVYQEQYDNEIVNVSIVIKRVGDEMNNPTKIFAIIAEKELNYAAPNGENVHHEVFRKNLLDQNFSLENVGDSIILNTSYTLHNDWVAEEMIVTAIIHDSETRSVLQANESSRIGDGTSSISDEVLSLDGVIYPNPATDVIHISPSLNKNFVQAEIFALTGNKVKSVEDPANSMNISDLPQGIYMLVLTDDKQRQHLARVIKQ
ncbi:MAG: T9SS type A sorting domain-containing protein [Bacteroidales bacterium]|jgi:thiol-disulfide isomerase/thioredoxin|nr:T9SS type A sorting domain-containing protein [Bacteroidales bacterium]